MKEQDIHLTLQETEQLCRLYMESRLSVIEETELHYVLGKLPYSSPCIDEVRRIMALPLSREAILPRKKQSRFLRIRPIVGIAASVAIAFVIWFSFLRGGTACESHPGDSRSFVMAYSHGKLLKDTDARIATDLAMAKADSLMASAFMNEQYCLNKANDIISTTRNN
ncbi:MAG: hypothetical protein K2K55_05185 [Duncaniella sp.]|nr:hypothetical protein [Duncaniella sp.]